MKDKEYQEWKTKTDLQIENNRKLLIEFGKCLEKNNLKSKTINNHINNIDF